ncbi:MAG: hypothetical protein C4527_19650 [Candidatus Omnitrophota bacterium]|jgi:transcription elongation factor Elf1|nr:MAG: hypothetical protein C4527_19650 [Candidatus Omnitrophota bacterium]
MAGADEDFESIGDCGYRIQTVPFESMINGLHAYSAWIDQNPESSIGTCGGKDDEDGQVYTIRHKVATEEKEIRETVREMKGSRNTVRKYLKASKPVCVKENPRRKPVWKKVGSGINELLETGRIGTPGCNGRENLKKHKIMCIFIEVPCVWNVPHGRNGFSF